RAVYLGNLPFSMENARLLQHTLLWLTQQETVSHPWLSNNPFVDVAFYPETNKATAVNFTNQEQQVTVFNTQGEPQQLALQPYEWCWFDN
ncbi:MAG: 1,3-beta-galactosyl-N-acetylhexosamine phosphorylase, partial [Vibrionaceae bacterium]|nr:1,3-beta-galactosyl-N-acetylhexosamine phosphorylase [Vibrionaceae bacterium]